MGNLFETYSVEKNSKKVNVFADFLQTEGLYSTETIDNNNLDDFLALLDGEVPIIGYCPECGSISTFRAIPVTFYREDFRGDVVNHKLGAYIRYRHPAHSWSQAVEEELNCIRISYVCGMDDSHRIEYVLKANATSVCKIGQYPTFADLSNQYKKVISSSALSEMRSALGLYAHGVGAGSYVYLRRVYEQIIDSAKDKAIADKTITQEQYNTIHVDQRIKMLRAYLPSEMVDKNDIRACVELTKAFCKM